MKNIYYITIFIAVQYGCKKEQTENARLRYVEDIAFEERIDNPDFGPCNGDDYVQQYFNDSRGLEYVGGKKAIINEFNNKYTSPSASKVSGLIRIRFIVDCEGNAGRHRLLGMDYKYEKTKFPKNITEQLMSITKSLDNWKPKTINDFPIDYYQYLSFKIENGDIAKILP